MFYTPEQKGLTQKEIDEICERLWKERQEYSNSNCHDCGVKPGEIHLVNCDTARCLVCGGQLLSCDCEDGKPDIWTGLWPGIKECYENKLITYDTCGNINQWGFDLNKQAMGNYEKKEEKEEEIERVFDLDKMGGGREEWNIISDDEAEKMLNKFGPEGLYEIARKLMAVADKDMQDAMNQEI